MQRLKVKIGDVCLIDKINIANFKDVGGGDLSNCIVTVVAPYNSKYARNGLFKTAKIYRCADVISHEIINVSENLLWPIIDPPDEYKKLVVIRHSPDAPEISKNDLSALDDIVKDESIDRTLREKIYKLQSKLCFYYSMRCDHSEDQNC